MTNDIEQQLRELGRIDAPKVDGAFANRLESNLRGKMVESEATRRPALPWLRPGVLVVGAVAALVVGALLVSDPSNDDGFADGVGTTTSTAPIDSTTVAPTTAVPTTGPQTTELGTTPTTSARADDAPEATAPQTTDPGTTAPQTTVPTTTVETTIPDTTVPETTIPDPSVALTIRRTDRAIVASWTIDSDVDGLAGWVLIRSLDGDGDVVEISRDPGTRRFRATITDLAQTFRVEGRTADGRVVISSDEVSAR